jgi:putative ABC transport system permease protein
VLTGLLLPVAAAAIPVARGCGVSVAAALRGPSLDDGVASWLQRWMRFESMPKPVALALRMVARRPGRSAMAMLTLAVAGGVFLGARSLRDGVLGSVDDSFSSYHFDFTLRFAEPHAVDSLESVVRAVDGVRSAEAWARASGRVSFADGSFGNTFSIVGLPAATSMLRPPIVSGRWLLPTDERSLVVSKRLLSSNPSLSIGSSVPVRIGGRTERWTVVGVAETGIDGSAYATREAVARANGSAGAATVVVAIGDTTSAGRLERIRLAREALRASALDVRTAQVVDAGRGALEDHLVMVVSFLGVMSQVMIVVGGLGLASTMSIAVIERTREIGVLRAIGATPTMIQLLVHIESLFIVVLSSVAAVILSVPIGRGLGAAFGRIMLPVRVDMLPGAASVAQWLGIVVTVSLVAALWPARRASAIQVREALAYE